MVKIKFAEWLDEQLCDRNWTRAELARQANISQSALSMVWSGDRRPGNEMCNAIASALHIPPDVVFRAAGLLPPELPQTTRRKILESLFETASDEDQEDAIAFLQHRREQREKRAKEADERARIETRSKTGPLGQH